MGILVGNGVNLYRRTANNNSRLVRTPISVNLNPDQMAVYQVPGTWKKVGSVWWPDGGFIDSNTVENIKAVGFNCLNAYVSHSDNRIGWGFVTSNHLPETVWYQGAYATSASTLSGSLNSCEAYIQLSAYHFTLPESLHSLNITETTVKFVNGSGIQCYQSPAIHSSSNTWLQGFGNWGQYFMSFVVTPSLGHYQYLYNEPYDAQIDILSPRSSNPRGSRDLWDFGSSNRDGGIPTMQTPVQQSYNMGSNTISVINSNKGCWIVPFIDVEMRSTTDYAPIYWNSNNGFWGCFSIWDLRITVTVDE